MSGKKVVGGGATLLILMLAAVASVSFTAFSVSVGERLEVKSARIKSLSNLKQVGLALVMYAQDYDERLPPLPNAAVAKKLLYPYLKNEAVFREPKTGRPYEVNQALSGARVARFARNAARVAVFYETLPDENGLRGVAFLDGHARLIHEDDWRETRSFSKIVPTAGEYLAVLRAAEERENRPRFFLLGLPVDGWGVFAFVVQVALPALFFRVFAPRRPVRP